MYRESSGKQQRVELVTLEELVPQAHSRAGTCGFVAGFLVMMVLDVALG